MTFIKWLWFDFLEMFRSMPLPGPKPSPYEDALEIATLALQDRAAQGYKYKQSLPVVAEAAASAYLGCGSSISAMVDVIEGAEIRPIIFWDGSVEALTPDPFVFSRYA